MDDYRLTTDDRTVQVGWLQELATNIAENLGEGTAEELVEYAMSEEGAVWGIEWPEWYDAQDCKLLVRFVGEALTTE